DALLAAEARHADRVAVLGRRAALAEPDERRELYLSMAELQASALGDLDGARQTLEAALALGDDVRVLRALASVADDETAMALWRARRRARAARRAPGHARRNRRDRDAAGAPRGRAAGAPRARHRRLAARARLWPAQRRSPGRAGRALRAHRPRRRAPASDRR